MYLKNNFFICVGNWSFFIKENKKIKKLQLYFFLQIFLGKLFRIKFSINAMKGNLILTPKNVQVFERTIEMLENSIVEMRQVVNNMIPESLVKFGLNVTLKEMCEDINNSEKMQINYQSSGIENISLDQTLSLHIYRIAEQRINNILKEATAKNVELSLVKQETKLTVIIDDDGIGFDDAVLNTTFGIGWDNIRNQIDFLKGTLDVHSKKEGTLVRIEISV